MARPARLLCCKHLPRNSIGRDLVVGDLHGHRALLERELERLGFDPQRDRVLSVGDLVDRGPDSLGTLSLILEPWFHAVLGNHEMLLLHHLHGYPSRRMARKAWSAGAGSWIKDAMAKHRKRLERLGDALSTLPLALHVDHDVPFNVMHGDLEPMGSRQERLHPGKTVNLSMAEELTWSRANVGTIAKDRLVALPCGERLVRLSDSPLGTLPLTYAGHSPLSEVTVHRSYVYIDQGLCAPARLGKHPPTVIDHHRFSHWLNGAIAARDPGAAVPRACRDERQAA